MLRGEAVARAVQHESVVVDPAALPTDQNRGVPRHRGELDFRCTEPAVLDVSGQQHLVGLLWLGDIVTALALHSTPPSVQEAGVPTNPVHVIDLSIVLPLHVIAGVALLRRRPLGYVLAPVVLAFGVPMALSLAGMMLVMRTRGFEASLALVSSMILIATASAAILAFLLRRLDAPVGRFS